MPRLPGVWDCSETVFNFLFYIGVQPVNIVCDSFKWDSAIHICVSILLSGFSGVTVAKNPPANAGDARNSYLIPRSRRGPGVGNGNLLQYPCLEHSMEREAWQVTVPGVSKSLTGLNGEHAFSSKLPSQRGCILHWAELPGLHSRCLLVMRLKYSSVYMSIPNSLSPPSTFPPGKHVSSLTSCKGS